MTYNCARCGNPWATHGTSCEERHVKPPRETNDDPALWAAWERDGYPSIRTWAAYGPGSAQGLVKTFRRLQLLVQSRSERSELIGVAADILEERLCG